MTAQEMESKALLRDQKPSFKNTTNQIKDLFLLRVRSSFLLSRGRGQPSPAAPGCLLLPAAASTAPPLTLDWSAGTGKRQACAAQLRNLRNKMLASKNANACI